MIFRRRSLVEPPAVLAGPRAIGERNQAVRYYSAHPAPTVSMAFSVYRDRTVKERLNELFGHKCAYCETAIAAGADYDVEHFRPKGGVVDEAGNKLTVGYWFLASDWGNLLPSCPYCNQSRWHGSGRERHKYGKENLFPLAAGSVHATAPGDLRREVPLLINPADESPQIHLGFVVEQRRREECIAFPLKRANGPDQKGSKSIQVYGLNRPMLVGERTKMVERFRAQLRLIARSWEASLSDPPAVGAAIREQARMDLREALRMYIKWDAPYSAACRSFYEDWKLELLQGLRRKAMTFAEA